MGIVRRAINYPFVVQLVCLLLLPFGLGAANTAAKRTHILLLTPSIRMNQGVDRAFVYLTHFLPSSSYLIEVCPVDGSVDSNHLLPRSAQCVSLEVAQLTHYDAVLSFSHKIPLGVWVDTIKANKKIQWIHTDLTAFPFRGFDDSLIEKIDAFVGSSDSVTQGFQKLFPVQSAKISTIHTPCDVAKIRQLATVEQRQIQQGTMAIVTACRLSPEQGLERAIRVCKRLDAEMIPFRWYVVGAGNKAYEQKLRTLVDTSGLQEKFVFLGSSTNPLPFIRAADIFVLPARVEGYAQSITEAQILGRAVVAANAGGASEQITNGVNGILVLDSEQGMYEGIQRLLLDQHLRETCSLGTKSISFNNTIAEKLNALLKS